MWSTSPSGASRPPAGQAIDDIVFCLLLPDALSLQRGSVLRSGAFVSDAVHADLREFVVLAAFFQVIAPDAGLRLECVLVLHARAEVAFFAVNVGRHPVAGNQVQAPAIHVEEYSVARRGSVGSVEAHDVESLIFDPDAAHEAALAGVLFGGHIEHEAAHVAEEFATNIGEAIVFAVEVGMIGIDHPRKSQGLILNLEELLEAAHETGLHVGFGSFR